MNITINDFEYRKGNVSSTQTIEKMFYTMAKAKAHASKLANCIAFCVENDKKPTASKEYMCHFKEGPADILDIGQWHTFLSPTNTGSSDTAKAIDDTGRGATLTVPAGSGRKRGSHTRSVTNFCKEANIAESDQLDLAEFIVAARYLGTDANDDQLMNVFLDMEDSGTDANAKDPKQLIKELMQKVAEDYGLDTDADAKQDGGDEDGDREIMASNPLDVFAEDAIWQEDQIDSFLNQNQQEQNLKIARNLLATTALTRHEIAEITGVEADLLMDYESDYSESEEEESGDENDDEEDDEAGDNDEEKVKVVKVDKDEAKEENLMPRSGTARVKEEVSEGVTIKASDFSKSVMLTKEDLGTLKELLDGGKESVSGKSEEALKLLKKLNNAININPKGHAKRTKTLARLKVDPVASDGDSKKVTEVKLPAKYRVVIHPGALCKDGKELASAEVCKLPIGTVVTVEEIDGRRARVTSPSQGWLSLHASDGRIILERSNVKSVAMDKAIHAERARQTKVLILKSITTLNDATVTRILEKSDWNLRRAIEAFYIAKYKTQEYLTKKEKKKEAKNNKGAGAETEVKAKKEVKVGGGGGGKASPVPAGGAGGGGGDAGKKGKKGTAWWKSWKTFANDNQ